MSSSLNNCNMGFQKDYVTCNCRHLGSFLHHVHMFGNIEQFSVTKIK